MKEKPRPIQSKNGQRIEKMLIDKILEADIVTNSARRGEGEGTQEDKTKQEKRQVSPFV